MRFLIVGLGSIGERHLKNLFSIGESDIIGVEIDKNRKNYIRKEYKIDVFQNLEDALNQKPDACFICTPPVSHVPIALEAAKAGCNLFIEKPISHDINDDLTKLEEIIEKNNLICMVGYNQRFNKGILRLKEITKSNVFGNIAYIRAEVGQDLPSWRPWMDYRMSYTAKKEMGGGIILDASHEIDYTLWLIDDTIHSVKSYYKKLSKLEVGAEDIAEVLIIFKNAYASIHMNMIERNYNRYCKIISDSGNWAIYNFKNRELVYSINGDNFKEVYKDYNMNQTYLDEIKHFISCIKSKSTPVSNIKTAKKTLKVCLMAKYGDK